MTNLNVAKAVGHAWWVAYGDLGPEQVLGAVEGRHCSEPNPVGEVGKVLQLGELWRSNVVIGCFLF